MNRTPPELDKIVDLVLAYRPPEKKKKLAEKAKKTVKKRKKNLHDLLLTNQEN